MRRRRFTWPSFLRTMQIMKPSSPESRRLIRHQVIAAYIAAFAVAGALLVSIFILIQTRNQLKTTERPYLAFLEDTVKINPLYTEGKMKGEIILNFRNIGKHPAKGLRYDWVTSFYPIQKPIDVKKGGTEPANNLDPEAKTDLHMAFDYLLDEREIQNKRYLQRELYIFLVVRYNDAYRDNKNYHHIYWFKYLMGKKDVFFMTIEERLSFESPVCEKFPEVKELLK